jgi:TnpA family transposase
MTTSYRQLKNAIRLSGLHHACGGPFEVFRYQWNNLISGQFTGLNAITVFRTLRYSLVVLAIMLKQQTELQPIEIMTDSGLLFWLFRLLDSNFCPRLADAGGVCSV